MASATTQSFAVPGADAPATTSQQRSVLRLWLSAVAIMIAAMVLVGGATRLTHSGLSITQWKPIMGIVPPLTQQDWAAAFDAYKKIPEYSLVNPNMDLSGFKQIFWWEWAHRFLGRMIGIVFFVPFLTFWAAGYIPRKLWPKLLGLFVLGGLQGGMGWYMVESGLVDRTDVSQYRLAAHFGIAVLIFGYTLWLIFGLSERPRQKLPSAAPAIVAGAVLGLIYLQLIAGAFVAGLDAGFAYNTWPLIDGAFVPHGLFALSPWFRNLFEAVLTVQFDHRMIAYLLLASIAAQAAWLAATRKPPLLVGTGLTLLFIALLQATLGVWTLLLVVPLPLGLAHQAGAIVLFGTAVLHFWLASHGVPDESPAPADQTAASA